MNPQQRNELRQRLAELSASDRKAIQKVAADRRAEAQRAKGHPRGRWSVEQWTLQLLSDAAPAEESVGVVVHLARERCRVRLRGEDIDCTLSREVGERQQTALAPGDEVVVRPHGDGFRVESVRERRSVLARRDPGNRNRERAIVANVDQVVVVVSVVAPPLHPRLIDRYLAAITLGGARPVIVVNKMDLCSHPDERSAEMAKLTHFGEMGIPVLPVSTAEGEGVEAVRAQLAGSLVAFVGHSGVGKSSLLSALLPSVAAEAGEVSAATGKGRHTTTASTLVEADGLRIIDTPGIREFSVGFDSAADLQTAFPDLQVGRCRFGDCLHVREPGCAVRDGLTAGTVMRPRYAMYRRLLEEITGESGEEPPDGFACGGCGTWVPLDGGGTHHRNHCPRCLVSKHLDDAPGDRRAGCGGLMEAIAVWVRRGGEWALVHRCRDCGKLASNRIAADDNEALLLSLAVRPLSRLPFPLEELGNSRLL